MAPKIKQPGRCSFNETRTLFFAEDGLACLACCWRELLKVTEKKEVHCTERISVVLFRPFRMVGKGHRRHRALFS